MANHGPRPTPDRIKRLHSTAQPCRVNQDAPPAIPGTPEPPSFLDAVARAEWDRLVPELERRGLIERVDLGVVATYCCAWSQFTRSEEALNSEGPVLIDLRGRVVPSGPGDRARALPPTA